MMRKGDKIIKKASNFLNLAPDLLCGGITITVYASSQAVISGYKKIVEFDDSILRVSDDIHELTIFGSDLILVEMTDDGLNVEGQIKSIDLNESKYTKN